MTRQKLAIGNALKKAALLAIGAMLITATLAAAQDVAATRGTGDLNRATIGSARVVDLARVPSVVVQPTQPAPRPPRPLAGISGAEYERRKAFAASEQSGALGPVAPPPSGSRVGRQTPGPSIIFRGQSELGSAPSDMAVAVSPKFVVQVVNSAIAVYNKSGAIQQGFPKSLKGLFPSSTGDVGDPRAFYDWVSNRFVIVADDFTGGVMWLAASVTSNPTGAWHIYPVRAWGAANCRTAGAACADFPTVGFDDSTIYLGVNFFPSSGGVNDLMLLLPKANIYAGTGLSFNFWSNLRLGTLNVDTVQPVTQLTKFEHPRAGFGINSFNINFGGGQCVTGCSGLMLWAFSNNLQTPGGPGPELSSTAIGTANIYRLPAKANEPGCFLCIDTGDVRISGTPIYHAGVITAALNTNGGDAHAHVLWFQVVPTLNDNDPRCTGAFLNACPQITTARLINEDCYLCGGEGAAGATYYATLAPDIGGDLTMVFNFSDINTFPESAFASRRATQAQNSMHDSGIVLCSGGARYDQERWGDYTAAVQDNESQGLMWFSAMNSLSNGNWGTCIGENGFTGSQP